MLYYVEVVGPYDAVRVGPFRTRDAADAHKATVPHNFTANVMTGAESRASDKAYGKIPLQSPDEIL